MTTKADFDFSTINPDKQASYGQIKMLGFRFSGKGFKAVTKCEDWKMGNTVRALILKYHNEVSKKPLTHGEVQGMLDSTKVLPKKYRQLYDPNYVKPEVAAKAVTVKASVVNEDDEEDNEPKVTLNGLKSLIAGLSDEDKAVLYAESEGDEDIPF